MGNKISLSNKCTPVKDNHPKNAWPNVAEKPKTYCNYEEVKTNDDFDTKTTNATTSVDLNETDNKLSPPHRAYKTLNMYKKSLTLHQEALMGGREYIQQLILVKKAHVDYVGNVLLIMPDCIQLELESNPPNCDDNIGHDKYQNGDYMLKKTSKIEDALPGIDNIDSGYISDAVEFSKIIKKCIMIEKNLVQIDELMDNNTITIEELDFHVLNLSNVVSDMSEFLTTTHNHIRNRTVEIDEYARLLRKLQKKL